MVYVCYVVDFGSVVLILILLVIGVVLLFVVLLFECGMFFVLVELKGMELLVGVLVLVLEYKYVCDEGLLVYLWCSVWYVVVWFIDVLYLGLKLGVGVLVLVLLIVVLVLVEDCVLVLVVIEGVV